MLAFAHTICLTKAGRTLHNCIFYKNWLCATCLQTIAWQKLFADCFGTSAEYAECIDVYSLMHCVKISKLRQGLWGAMQEAACRHKGAVMLKC